MSKRQMDIAFLRQTFSYDPDTGDFVRIKRRSGPNPESIRGTVNDGGYSRIRFQGRKYYVHVLAWAHFHGRSPLHSVDHRDGDQSNNRIANLREATHQENCCNRRRRSDNAAGHKGICWDRQHKKYRVQITVKGHRVFQALCRTKQEAATLYEERSRSVHGEFARAD